MCIRDRCYNRPQDGSLVWSVHIAPSYPFLGFQNHGTSWNWLFANLQAVLESICLFVHSPLGRAHGALNNARESLMLHFDLITWSHGRVMSEGFCSTRHCYLPLLYRSLCHRCIWLETFTLIFGYLWSTLIAFPVGRILVAVVNSARCQRLV